MKKTKVRMCNMEKYIEKVNVLLVDDRPENLLALEAVLGDLDYNLIRAYSGEEALKCLLKDDFAVILLDVQMPGLNGFETAKIIKSRPKTKDTPIIFITAISKAPENVYTGYSVGAIDYVFKPFEPDVLKSKIESFTAIHRNKKGLEEYTELLLEKTQSLEKANQDLIETTLKLKKSEALNGIIKNTSIDAMITYNESFEILTVNPATKQMFGYEEVDLIGQKIMQIIPAATLAIEFGHEFGKRLEVTGVRSDSSNFPVEVQLGNATIDNHSIYACTIRDISELKTQMNALAHQALHDSLTSLPNRNLLYDRLEQGVKAAKNDHSNFSLILIDLNHFKVINDTLGHHFGDLLLQQVGNRLVEIVNVKDTVARLGAPPTVPRTFGEVAVIAWNRSTETARAVLGAMPLLRKARRVVVLELDDWGVPGPSGSELARSLRMHDIAAEAMTAPDPSNKPGETILAESTALGCDLLIKGAYTQSRLRQMFFGGATSHILSNTTIPVLMAH